MTLRDVLQKAGPNPGGAVNLYLCKLEDIVTIPAETVGADGSKTIDTDITVKGDGFKHWQFAPGTCNLMHPTVGERGSASFGTEIAFILNGDDERVDQFEEMINGLFVAILDTASGLFRLVGNKRSPLTMEKADYALGADQPERNGTTFSLKGYGGRYSRRYKGAIPVVAAPAVV